MKLVGLDPSINGSGITICEVDDNYDIINETIESYYMTETKSKVEFNYNTSINGIFNIKSNKFDTLYHKIEFVVEEILKILPKPDECFIILESNAFAGGGRIVDISEFTGALKYRLLFEGYKFTQFEPTSIPTVIGKVPKFKSTQERKTFLYLALETNFKKLHKYIFRDITDDKLFKIGTSPSADVVDSLLIILYYLKLLKEK